MIIIIIEPTVHIIAMDICAITEWFGFNIGVVALINPVMIQITIIPITYPTTEIGPKNTVKNIHNNIYQAIDSENIMYPLSIPKCSVSKPVMISFPFVIAKGEYGDFVTINVKNIIAARGNCITKGPCTA